MNKVLSVFLVFLLFNSCTLLRIQEFGHTPKKPGSYPKFTSKDYLTGLLDEYRAGYDVTFYDLDLHIDPDKYTIGGEVIICLRAVSRLKNIRFDLHENLHIESLKFSGKEIPFVREESAVIASLEDSLVVGTTYSLIVVYEGKPVIAKNPPWSGGVVWDRDKNGNPWIGVACETEGAGIWFPCKDHLSDEPDSVRLRITVPEGLQVVSIGVLESHVSQPGMETYTWRTHYPVNIYNITFYTGKFSYFTDTLATEEGILNLEYYVMPENLQRAKEHFTQVPEIIRIYSDCFGPYPWLKEGFKLVEGPFGGMEHQTAIAYGSGYKNFPALGGDDMIVHEAAHEWWGNAVSVSDFCDIWLQEGFATYSEILYVERKKGFESSLTYASSYIASMINNKLPVAGPPDVNYWDNRDNDVYNKGAMVLHTMRNIINDSLLFFDILQTFYREHAAASHVTTADFIEIVERKTGKDWDKFFEAYIYRREVPVLNLCYGKYDSNKNPVNSDSKNATFIAARWINVPDGFTMPIEMNCNDSEAPAIFEVSTNATLFSLKNSVSCNQWICNKRLSYFKTITDKNLLKEIL
ncbi:MAG: hypothetical protein A2X05_00370 [Bacteroidetes bacterium GWE2_41_25]|nr:MAG: hypothetical protein A2X03_01770 [Bacteroidetes bacterium GWA2_40_15]OFX85831.1 MAG: hypothetical protein A2X06_10955 [Bacteroidetes bacterium GWC2_40_22]OFX97458.1 MAG: hypothetical protein A2X05_00370 [Bacteroidetes bacterium GWE2_41_25]OFY59750.1 MAG: hypothetical protein A2X04_11450 [Bacteroidetes bacterium GWF2_41_9]HBH85825.1 M1 family peptidase [Bacteroidales bacterium]